MRARKIEAPRCPVHVGAQMVLHKRMVPIRLLENLLGRDTKGSSKIPGAFFKCPIKSCARVERVPNEFEDAA